MATVIGVRFKNLGKIYYFDPEGCEIQSGSHVIVETARGVECGEVAMPNREIADDHIVQPLKPIIRVATDGDMDKLAENCHKEVDAFAICQKKIAIHKLGMKLVDVEYTFDNSKILFYFTADGRVDFRELVKDLASVFRTRIELRQIGVRDEAKMLGGLGLCGRPFCCSQFLAGFQPVSIKMAKEQGLSLNPVKISGTCGRLMCCLKYEQEAYQDLQKNTPPQGSYVSTPEGRGTIVGVSLLTGVLQIHLDSSSQDAAPANYKVSQVKVLHGPAPHSRQKPHERKLKPEDNIVPTEGADS
ncbi:MAG: stage 0 sporulation family protein [Oscillospiraceae bacterium]|jgi:cell fate regulator YaaT (PSP1 superfamily)|nr:stage 0 sporulation family protein [Oscillospiraceae bacterium]